MSPRRRLLAFLGGAFVSPRAFAQPVTRHSSPVTDSAVTPFAQPAIGYRLRFPQDEGSHPVFRTEWWYVTGWLQRTSSSPDLGFQVTFFRTRPEIDERNPSAFTSRQIMIAHAALSDTKRGRLLHDQTVARAALGLAGADEGRTHVWIDDWSLLQEGSVYRTRIPGREFAFDLAFTATQPPFLQGTEGLSRKGPRAESASHYYSLPHLAVSGDIVEGGRKSPVTGSAWLDHEWSSSYLDERAAGWDWIGLNFDDGGALMAFRMRDAKGGKFWAGGASRSASGTRHSYAPDEIDFAPLRLWRSARTGATYPVEWRVRLGLLDLTIEPLMDDQEIDTRVSVGTVYWEGAARVLRDGKPVGRGYLELTGYWKPMKL